MTHQVKMAPPVSKKSVMFIASSIAIIDIKDIPIAVLNASIKDIWRANIRVSRQIELSKPFPIASVIIAHTGHGISVIWKKAIVPKSPIEQPKRHHEVL